MVFTTQHVALSLPTNDQEPLYWCFLSVSEIKNSHLQIQEEVGARCLRKCLWSAASDQIIRNWSFDSYHMHHLQRGSCDTHEEPVNKTKQKVLIEMCRPCVAYSSSGKRVGWSHKPYLACVSVCEMLKMRGDENWIKLCVAAHCREVIRDKHWDAESDLSCWRLSEIGAASPSIPVAQWLEFPNVGLMGCQPGAQPLRRTTHNNKWSKIRPD